MESKVIIWTTDTTAKVLTMQIPCNLYNSVYIFGCAKWSQMYGKIPTLLDLDDKMFHQLPTMCQTTEKKKCSNTDGMRHMSNWKVGSKCEIQILEII